MKTKLTLDQFKVQYRIARLNGLTHDTLSASYFKYLAWYEVHKGDKPSFIDPTATKTLEQRIHIYDADTKPNKEDYTDYKEYRKDYLIWYERSHGDRHSNGYYKKYNQERESWYCKRLEHEKCQLKVCRCSCHKVLLRGNETTNDSQTLMT